MGFTLLAEIDAEGGLLKNGAVPWDIPAATRFFEETTKRAVHGKVNAVIMAAPRYHALPPKNRPLGGRYTFVLSRSGSHVPGPRLGLATSLEDALRKCAHLHKEIDEIFVIGGQDLSAVAMDHPDCERVILTRIDHSFGCDRFFPLPTLAARFSLHHPTSVGLHDHIRYRFESYLPKPRASAPPPAA